MAGLFKKVSARVTANLLPSTEMNKPEEAWRDAARQLGLNVTPGARIGHPMIIAGQLRGVIIEAQPGFTDIGDAHGPTAREFWTYFAADFPSAAPPIRLQTRGVSSILKGGWSKRPDALEDRIKVGRGEGDALARFLTPARRDAVWALEDEFAPVTITERSFKGRRPEVIGDAATLVASLNRIVDLVLVIGSPDTIDLRSPAPPPVPPPGAAAPPPSPPPPGRPVPPQRPSA